MDISSHYYGIYALCIACGIRNEVAAQIAHASQYVDDARINTITFDRDYMDSFFPVENGRSKISNVATCHSYFALKQFNYQSMIFNTSAFHFFPGNTGECFTRRLRCRKNPKILRDLLLETVAERPLIPEKLGMLLHTFADTYSHQGFSGLLSKVNDIKDLHSKQEGSFVFRTKSLLRGGREAFFGFFDRFLPAYGHGQAYAYPDIPYGRWHYSYDRSDDFSGAREISENDNSTRFMEAFQTIARDFLLNISDESVFFGRDLGDTGEKIDIVCSTLIEPMSYARKIRRLKEVMADFGHENVEEYCEERYLKETFANYDKKTFSHRVVHGAQLQEGYAGSSWYIFMKAMKWYKGEFIARLAADGLHIPC